MYKDENFLNPENDFLEIDENNLLIESIEDDITLIKEIYNQFQEISDEKLFSEESCKKIYFFSDDILNEISIEFRNSKEFMQNDIIINNKIEDNLFIDEKEFEKLINIAEKLDAEEDFFINSKIAIKEDFEEKFLIELNKDLNITIGKIITKETNFEKNIEEYSEKKIDFEENIDANEKDSLDNIKKNIEIEKLDKKINLKQNNKTIILCSEIILFGLCIGFSIGIGKSLTDNYLANKSNINESEKDEDKNIEQQQDQFKFSFANIVDNIEPSLVCITTDKINENSSNLGKGEGSGIFFKEDEERIFIITNNHVIENSRKIDVTFGEKKFIKTAYIFGKDSDFDIAIIFINKIDLNDEALKEIKYANFGNSDNMRTGDFVLVMGNALGEGNSTTYGVISAKNKKINIEGISLEVFQTDAAINPGNSGGALVNTKSEIIGITTAKLSKETIEGTGYSIGSNLALLVADRIFKRETITSLGIVAIDLDEQLKNKYKFDINNGVFVVAKTNANNIDIKECDLIISINNIPIKNKKDLKNILNQKNSGDIADLKILRDENIIDMISIVLN